MTVISSLLAMLTLSACDKSFIFDYEGNCSVVYKVDFKYDLNLKWANAFTNEVGSVRLYAFDNDGILVKEFDRSGEELKKDDFSIIMDLNPGDYKLLAWCGVDNPGTKQNFDIPEGITGVTTLKEVTCQLKRYEDEIHKAYSEDRLEFMFHGRLDVNLPDASTTGGEFLYTVPLTKDTNHVRVVLQHLSGEDLDVSKFSFRIEDANGFYAHDNSVLEDDLLTYRSYSKSQGLATLVKDKATRVVVQSQTAIADMSVARLMADRSQNMILTVTNDKGEDIAKIPVIDYALLTKDYYEEAYGHKMTDQEFLDREDEYIMTLFLDEDYRWYSAEIYINSWRVVFKNYDVE